VSLGNDAGRFLSISQVIACKNGGEAWRLGPDEVQVWSVDLERAKSEAALRGPPILSDDEWERARRIREPVSRRHFIIARSLLRTILGGYTGIEPRAIAFAYDSFGKPGLAASGNRSPIYFNLSHSEGVALFAVTGVGAVGIDVERIRAIPESEDIAAACFPDCERERLRSLPDDQRAAGFMRSWTRLEAVLKASGSGWIGPGAGLDLLEVPAFSIYEVAAPPGYAAALALARPDCRVVQQAWNEAVPKSGRTNRPNGGQFLSSPPSWMRGSYGLEPAPRPASHANPWQCVPSVAPRGSSDGARRHRSARAPLEPL